jgi:hypothetical protein
MRVLESFQTSNVRAEGGICAVVLSGPPTCTLSLDVFSNLFKGECVLSVVEGAGDRKLTQVSPAFPMQPMYGCGPWTS